MSYQMGKDVRIKRISRREKENNDNMKEKRRSMMRRSSKVHHKRELKLGRLKRGLQIPV